MRIPGLALKNQPCPLCSPYPRLHFTFLPSTYHPLKYYIYFLLIYFVRHLSLSTKMKALKRKNLLFALPQYLAYERELTVSAE